MKALNASTKQIEEYWSERGEFEFEMYDSSRHDCFNCWACGVPLSKGNVDRCHIIARALGGSDHPSNLVLMCKPCHRESPDTIYPAVFWEWFHEKKERFDVGFPTKDTCDFLIRLIAEHGVDTVISAHQEVIDIDNTEEIFLWQAGRPFYETCNDALRVIEMKCKEIKSLKTLSLMNGGE